VTTLFGHALLHRFPVAAISYGASVIAIGENLLLTIVRVRLRFVALTSLIPASCGIIFTPKFYQKNEGIKIHYSVSQNTGLTPFVSLSSYAKVN
jgi:hypothetical protein